MEHKLPDLPYRKSALEPFLSEQAIEIHYEKHHRGYVKKLNKILTDQQQYQGISLEGLVCKVPLNSGIFNTSAQTWNHTFFWRSLSPDSDNSLSGIPHLPNKSTIPSAVWMKCWTNLNKQVNLNLAPAGCGWLKTNRMNWKFAAPLMPSQCFAITRNPC